MSTYQTIYDAVKNQQIVRATYRNYVRVMCPHVLGTKNGRQQALCYQFDGESSTGLEPGGSENNWRCMFLDELSDVSVESGTWHTAPNQSRPQTCVDAIDIEVAF